MNRFQSNMNLFSTILVMIALCLPIKGYSDVPKNPLGENAKQNENPNVASLTSLSYTCQSYSVTSTTDHPGAKEIIYTEDDFLEIKANFNIVDENNYQALKWYLDGELVQTGNRMYVFDSSNSIPSKYLIEAKYGNCKKAIIICKLICVPLRVDVSDPIHGKVYYQLYPTNIEVNGQFSIQDISNIYRKVSNEFYFEFNQNDIHSSKNIVFSFNKDNYQGKSRTIPLSVHSKQKTNDTCIVVYYILEGVGLRAFHWSITANYIEYEYAINTIGNTLHFIPASNTQYDATLSAFISLQGISPNDGEYSFIWTHRFNNEANGVILERPLYVLESYWIFRGHDIDVWKNKNITSTCLLNMSCDTPNGPAMGIRSGNSLTLSFD